MVPTLQYKADGSQNDFLIKIKYSEGYPGSAGGGEGGRLEVGKILGLVHAQKFLEKENCVFHF